jgi:hypothetical protein
MQYHSASIDFIITEQFLDKIIQCDTLCDNMAIELIGTNEKMRLLR